MCKCVNVDFGTYANEVVIKREDLPDHMKAYSTKTSIGIDACILDEVKGLWALGITTTWSCCGHNKELGAIGVEDSDIPKMKALGYKVWHNNCRPNDEDSFIAMTCSDEYFGSHQTKLQPPHVCN